MNHTIIEVPGSNGAGFGGLNDVFSEITAIQEELQDTGVLDQETKTALGHLVGFQAMVRAAAAAEELAQALHDLSEIQETAQALEQQADGFIGTLRQNLDAANGQSQEFLRTLPVEGRIRRTLTDLLATMIEFAEQTSGPVTDAADLEAIKDNAIQHALDLRDVLSQLRDFVLDDV